MENKEGTSPPLQLKIAIQVGFVVIGIVTVLLGQVLPMISQRLVLDDAQAGTLFLAQFAGSIAGTLASGPMIRRIGFVASLLFGLMLLVLGIPGLNGTSIDLCRVAIFIYGLGLGITIPVTNLLVIGTTEPAKRASEANLINFCWGLGAISSRPFVVLFGAEGGLTLVTLTLDALLIVVAIILFSARRSVVLPEADPLRSVGQKDRIWTHPLAWLIAFFNFLNIGVESGLGGWLTTYSERLQAEGGLWVNATVVFFAFMVLGRGAAVVVSKQMSENSLLLACVVTLLCGVALILVTGHSLMPLTGAALAGLGTSAVFPTNTVRFAKTFGPDATRKAAPLFISGTVGAAILSSLVGFVSARTGRLENGIVVLAAAAAALLVVQILFSFTPVGRISYGEARTVRRKLQF